ncbi:MAG TPA: hypothetical protein ACFE0H_00850 [Elainellaceae cyanobacterium]
MTPEQHHQLQTHVNKIAKLSYAGAEAIDMPMATLAEIELTVRQQLLHYVSPGLGNFLSQAVREKTRDIPED